MADQPACSDSKRDATSHGSAPKTPRWVKGSAIVAVVLVVGVIVLHLTGLVGMGGNH
jgi:hypothetical protein